MKKILIGSPYGSIPELSRYLESNSISELSVIESNSIVEITPESFSTALGETHAIDEIHKAFFRYPYDLIPPFTQTFPLREKTEFWKSLFLLLGDRSLNDPPTAWAMRNRFASLKTCRDFGLNVPDHYCRLSGQVSPHEDSDAIAKALGNCFVAESEQECGALSPHCTFMTDDGDSAYVFEAQVLDAEVTHSLTSGIQGALFSQERIKGETEMRCYLIGDSFFQFRRQSDSSNIQGSVDKSACDLVVCTVSLSSNFIGSIAKINRELHFRYSCLDVIIDDEGVEHVIDFNPFGSLPDASAHPAPTIALAEELLS